MAKISNRLKKIALPSQRNTLKRASTRIKLKQRIPLSEIFTNDPSRNYRIDTIQNKPPDTNNKHTSLESNFDLLNDINSSFNDINNQSDFDDVNSQSSFDDMDNNKSEDLLESDIDNNIEENDISF